MNFKLIGEHLINFDNVTCVKFATTSYVQDITKATIYFNGGSVLPLEEPDTTALLNWMDEMNDAEVVVIPGPSNMGTLAAVIERAVDRMHDDPEVDTGKPSLE